MHGNESTVAQGYVRVSSIADAIAALQAGGVVIAGGVVVNSLINQGLFSGETLVDISRIDSLRRIDVGSDGHLVIGALASHDDILKSRIVASMAPLLVEIAKEVSCGRLRNQGTLGGGLCMIGQQGDPATGLIALGAKLCLHGPDGRRIINIEDFYRNAFELDRRPDELVEEVWIPAAGRQQLWAFVKLGPRNAMDWTQIAVSVALTPDELAKKIISIRIGMNGVAPAALRARQAEDALKDQPLHAIEWPSVIESLNDEMMPQGDVVFSEHYKRHVASVLLRRAVQKALANL